MTPEALNRLCDKAKWKFGTCVHRLNCAEPQRAYIGTYETMVQLFDEKGLEIPDSQRLPGR